MFQDERWHDLIVILDDATSEIYYAQLAPEETTFTVMAGLRAVIEQKRLFCSLYSDRGAHFWLSPVRTPGGADRFFMPEALDACVSNARLWWLCLLRWLCNRPFRRPFHTCLCTEWVMTS